MWSGELPIQIDWASPAELGRLSDGLDHHADQIFRAAVMGEGLSNMVSRSTVKAISRPRISFTILDCPINTWMPTGSRRRFGTWRRSVRRRSSSMG